MQQFKNYRPADKYSQMESPAIPISANIYLPDGDLGRFFNTNVIYEICQYFINLTLVNADGYFCLDQ